MVLLRIKIFVFGQFWFGFEAKLRLWFQFLRPCWLVSQSAENCVAELP